MRAAITVETTIEATIETVWKRWTTAADIMQWNHPSEEWHSPRAELNLEEGGSFLFRMETKDGSAGFNHSGRYDKIVPHQLIGYTGDDGRKTIIHFTSNGAATTIVETFEPEAQTPVDLQRDFCQGVLNHFKQYTERNKEQY